MSKSPLPLILAGGAALLLLGGSRRKGPTRKIVEADFDVVYAPAQAPAEETPPPESLPSTHREVSDQEIGQMLLELGYQGYSPAAIMEFQKDWNSMMMWLWENNPQIDEDTPNYGPIDIDGKWGKKTESRAVRALKNVPPGERVAISLGDKIIEVDSFRDAVHKVWEYSENESSSIYESDYVGDGIKIYHFRAGNGSDGYYGELYLQDKDNPDKIITIHSLGIDGMISVDESISKFWRFRWEQFITFKDIIHRDRNDTSEIIKRLEDPAAYSGDGDIRIIDGPVWVELTPTAPVGSKETLKRVIDNMVSMLHKFTYPKYIKVRRPNGKLFFEGEFTPLKMPGNVERK